MMGTSSREVKRAEGVALRTFVKHYETNNTQRHRTQVRRPVVGTPPRRGGHKEDRMATPHSRHPTCVVQR